MRKLVSQLFISLDGVVEFAKAPEALWEAGLFQRLAEFGVLG